MSATEDPRAMLDEMDCKWEDVPIGHGYQVTRWWAYGHVVSYCEDYRGCTVGFDATPAQAIEATPGRGECRPKAHEKWTTVLLPDIAWNDDDWPDYLSVSHSIDGEWRAYAPERGECRDAAGSQMAFFSCSACGATTERKHPRFCFACGRKVVQRCTTHC